MATTERLNTPDARRRFVTHTAGAGRGCESAVQSSSGR